MSIVPQPRSTGPEDQNLVNKHVVITDEVARYIRALLADSQPMPLLKLCDTNASLPSARMQTELSQAVFLKLLAELMGARRVLEVGTFRGFATGYLALAVGQHGRVITCDIDERAPAVGRPCWEELGVLDRIDLRIGPAADTMAALVAAGEQFDLIFIDADKRGYRTYIDHAMQLVRPGGLLCIDNTLWHGSVADPAADDAATQAIREVNTYVFSRWGQHAVLIPAWDGMTIIRCGA